MSHSTASPRTSKNPRGLEALHQDLRQTYKDNLEIPFKKKSWVERCNTLYGTALEKGYPIEDFWNTLGTNAPLKLSKKDQNEQWKPAFKALERSIQGHKAQVEDLVEGAENEPTSDGNMSESIELNTRSREPRGGSANPNQDMQAPSVGHQTREDGAAPSFISSSIHTPGADSTSPADSRHIPARETDRENRVVEKPVHDVACGIVPSLIKEGSEPGSKRRLSQDNDGASKRPRGPGHRSAHDTVSSRRNLCKALSPGSARSLKTSDSFPKSPGGEDWNAPVDMIRQHSPYSTPQQHLQPPIRAPTPSAPQQSGFLGTDTVSVASNHLNAASRVRHGPEQVADETYTQNLSRQPLSDETNASGEALQASTNNPGQAPPKSEDRIIGGSRVTTPSTHSVNGRPSGSPNTHFTEPLQPVSELSRVSSVSSGISVNPATNVTTIALDDTVADGKVPRSPFGEEIQGSNRAGYDTVQTLTALESMEPQKKFSDIAMHLAISKVIPDNAICQSSIETNAALEKVKAGTYKATRLRANWKLPERGPIYLPYHHKSESQSGSETQEAGHWSLIVIRVGKAEIRWYDSLGLDCNVETFLKTYLDAEIGTPGKPWSLEKMPCARQNNDYDCGVFAALYAYLDSREDSTVRSVHQRGEPGRHALDTEGNATCETVAASDAHRFWLKALILTNLELAPYDFCEFLSLRDKPLRTSDGNLQSADEGAQQAANKLKRAHEDHIAQFIQYAEDSEKCQRLHLKQSTNESRIIELKEIILRLSGRITLARETLNPETLNTLQGQVFAMQEIQNKSDTSQHELRELQGIREKIEKSRSALESTMITLQNARSEYREWRDILYDAVACEQASERLKIRMCNLSGKV